MSAFRRFKLDSSLLMVSAIFTIRPCSATNVSIRALLLVNSISSIALDGSVFTLVSEGVSEMVACKRPNSDSSFVFSFTRFAKYLCSETAVTLSALARANSTSNLSLYFSNLVMFSSGPAASI